MQLALDEGEGFVFHLKVHAAEVLADDAEQQRVDTEGAEDEYGEGGESGGGAESYGEVGDDVSDAGQYGDGGYAHSDVGSHAQGHDGMVDDAVEREHEIGRASCRERE